LLVKSIHVALLSLAIAGAAHAQVQDTIASKSPLFTGRDALILGAFTLATVAVAPVDKHFADRLQNPAAQENRFLRTSATGFRLLGSPGSLITGVGLYVIGRADGQRRVEDLGLHSVESMLLADLIGGGIKVLAGRARPYVDVKNPYSFQLGRGLSGNDYRSFPSGHSINAFAFASTVSRETQMWWPHSRWYVGTVMYGGASLVALSRMYNNAHWASDVVAGAAIGTIVGLKVVKFQHSHPDNRIDRELLRANYEPAPRRVPILVTFHFR
jgi:Membrane-associated phospholipid phosphatase